jgi:hypothetical protein
VQKGGIILFDKSGSMQGAKLEGAKQAAESALWTRATLLEEWALLSFSEHNVHLEQGFSQDPEAFSAAIGRIQAEGDTPLAWAVAQALIYLYSNTQAPTGQILILSDGKEECPERSPGGGKKAIEALNRVLRNIPLAQASPDDRMPRAAAALALLNLVALQAPAADSRVLGRPNETVEDALRQVETVVRAAPKKLSISVVGLGIAAGSEDEQQLQALAAAGNGRYVAAAAGAQLLPALTAAGGMGGEQEPNNTLGKANPISATGQVQGSIQAQRDEDWFVLEVDRPGRLNMRTAKVPDKLDLHFIVRNAEGAALSNVFTPAKAGAETVGEVGLPAKGKYYVQLWDGNHDAVAAESYTLEVRFEEGDAYELNNTVGTATPIKPTDQVLANILPLRDVDWYTFEVPRRGALKFSVTQAAKELDLQFMLRNAENYDLTGWIRPLAAGADNVGVVDLPTAGRYYLVVADVGDNAAAAQNYKLEIAYLEGDKHEANDSIGTATRLEPTAKVSASILPKGDQDIYTFEVPHPGVIDVRIEKVPANLTLQFLLRNAEHYDLTGWQRPLRAGAENQATLDLPTAGRYYLHVGDVAPDQRSAEPYSLQLTYHRADAQEPNNSFGTATPITVAKEVQGSILPRRDHDWYVFQAAQAGTYELSITNVAQELDIHAVVRNAENAAVSDTIRPLRAGAETRGVFKLPAAGKYYLQVFDGNDDARAASAYTLKVAPVSSP